ncbi:hypothetical protein GCM10009555_008780 [Acrocarpospora macrocephala]|uniref:Lipoprotein n=1 Tax=Acrocarpospora macrocephala TaxID=150177 RepID=A0A5M3X1H3_9ACTN|nr:hypothetical protein [Acrocarpospora macrocephala]GES14840.1 hypothetical protein Amac_084370 [Acrocarpospora macrocephala]
MTLYRAAPLLLIPFLAACAANADPGAVSSPSPSVDLAVFRELARCVRANGAPNFPDPTVDAQGEIKMESSVKVPASAETACKSIMNRLPAQGGQKPPTAAELDQLRKLAQCFREHGVTDWPDPDSMGVFHVNKRIDDLGKRAWLPARDACKQYFVVKSLRVAGPDDKGKE